MSGFLLMVLMIQLKLKYLKTTFQILIFRSNTKDGDLNRSQPELFDQLQQVVYIWYHVAFNFELQTGLRWSMLLAFADRVQN